MAKRGQTVIVEGTNLITASGSMHRINNLIDAGNPVIWIRTHEENRFCKDIVHAIINRYELDLWTWSSVQGLRKITKFTDLDMWASAPSGGELKDTDKLKIALNFIATVKSSVPDRRIVVILKDINNHLSGDIARRIRDMHVLLGDTGKTLLLISSSIGYSGKDGIEPTLEKQVTVVDYELPTHAMLKAQVILSLQDGKHNLANLKSPLALDYTDAELNEFATALQGLTLLEALNACAICFSALKKLEVPFLLKEKKQQVARTGILEYIDIAPGFQDVGGCDLVKQYFLRYKKQFTPEAEKFGVTPLKGVLMTGIPGTGKSLLAKAVAATWGVPLLRLDVGKVMAGIVGASEERMRMVIDQAEAVAPTVLWIDEIEKSLSGTKSSNFSDGGTMSRVFGTLLTAMEERMRNVVVIATANDISSLPPELVRRFNETFFVDLPTANERREIFNIHLRKKGRDSKKLKLDLEKLVKDSDHYTGSEIEKAVHTAIAMAFADDKEEIDTNYIATAISDTRPIHMVMSEQIEAIQKWATGRARYASSEAAHRADLLSSGKGVVTRGGKVLDIEDDIESLDQDIKTKPEIEQEANKSRRRSRGVIPNSLIERDEPTDIITEE